MQDMTLPRQPINPEKADEDLRALIGDEYLGMSTHQDVIVVHLSDQAGDAAKASVLAYFEQHDPTAKSAAEQTREDKAEAWGRWKSADLDAIEETIKGGSTKAALLDILALLKDLKTGLSNE